MNLAGVFKIMNEISAGAFAVDGRSCEIKIKVEPVAIWTNELLCESPIIALATDVAEWSFYIVKVIAAATA